MENKGSSPTQGGGTIHYADVNGNGVYQSKNYNLPTGDSVTNFHSYAIQWASNSIIWQVDGQNVQTWTSWGAASGTYAYPAPFNQPFYLIMNLAVGGQFLGSPSDSTITNNTVFPGEMQVDYVRVYDDLPAALPPDPPTGLTAGPGNAKAFLNWDASSSGATGYKVKRAATSEGPYTTIASPAANSYTDTNASNCATYYYVVSATNSFGESTNSNEASVTLGAFSLAVNSGGSASGQFIADANFSGGTQAAPFGAIIDTSGVNAPAPQAVYQTERYGSFTYTLSGMTPGVSYKVRLHFAETYWTAVGQRCFNVFINSTQVLTNCDIIAAAGAQDKATIKEFMTPANGSGQMVIQYATVTDNAKSSGIEILLSPPAAPAALTAAAGNSQVALSWSSSVSGATYNLKRSLVSGGSYTPVAAGLTTTNYTDTGLTNGPTYSYVVSAFNAGCESTNSTQVSATPTCVPPPAPTVGNNGPLCEGSTLNLAASTVPGATYSWTGPNGFVSSVQNPSITGATTSASGTYSVTATANGCASPAGTTVAVVNAIPAAPTAGNNGPINAGATLNLTASTVPGATYSWTGPNGFTSPAQNPSIVNATTNATGLYSVTATVGTCTSPAGTTTVTVNALLDVTMTIQASGTNITIGWPSGTLQSATNLLGPWEDVTGAAPPTYNATNSEPQQYFRVR